MASINKVTILGNLGSDPEVRFAKNGTAIANFNVATTDRWKDATGAKKEKTEWHRVVIFGKQAETAGQYLKKGSPVMIEGSLQTRDYVDSSSVKRYITEVRAQKMQLISRPAKTTDPIS